MPVNQIPTQLLPNGIEGATHSPLLITWKDGDSTAIDLSGAMITARIRNTKTRATHDSTGSLAVVNGPAGMFSWAYALGDLVKGDYEVQFTATYEDNSYEATPLLFWKVTEYINQPV